MINIVMKTKGAVDRNSILTINNSSVQGKKVSSDLNPAKPTPVNPNPASPAPARKQIPQLIKPVQKGQKVSLEANGSIDRITACFGWNTSNPACDVDVSAFLLGTDGKVPGDSWFVFYGQTFSPDRSTELKTNSSIDREEVLISLQKLNTGVQKIVFVLTINDAFEKNLNFGMMKDAYVRILDERNHTELVSFQMTDYYSNVISMMIGEIYKHNGIWKFHAVGNGVARDLAGLCDLYGVQVND